MSQQDHIQIVKEIYEAVGRGDIDAIVERVADDVDWAAEVAGNAARRQGHALPRKRSSARSGG
jgi:ketosteroid isomerase-like protein